MKIIRRFATLAVAIAVFQHAMANDFNLPVSSNTNDNPFVQIHGLQGFSGVDLPQEGKFSTRFMLITSNEFYQQVLENEQINLDFERTTLSLDFAYGLSEQWAMGIKLPYMINSGGFLDGLIEDWHDLFGLPQGGRDDAAQDEFRIAYSSGNDTTLIDNARQGIGDISVYADNLLFDSSTRRVKARAKLKLPTAKEDQLFGSGGYVLSLHLNAASKLSEKVIAYGGGGVSYLTEGDVFSERQKNWIAAATLGIGWQLRTRLMLSAQLDLNSRIYDDTDLDAISGEAGVLFVAAQYRLYKQIHLQLGFTEDVINKDAAPDFGLRMGITF